jgi:hypothetical protein
MKYTKRKTPEVGSSAAAAVKKLLDSQEPPLGNREAAEMIGLNYETMRAVVNDHRIPSTGVIYGLAKVCNADDKWVEKTLELRQQDLLQKKVTKAMQSPQTDGLESLVTILGALNKKQIADLKKRATELALANRSGTK